MGEDEFRRDIRVAIREPAPAAAWDPLERVWTSSATTVYLHFLLFISWYPSSHVSHLEPVPDSHSAHPSTIHSIFHELGDVREPPVHSHPDSTLQFLLHPSPFS
eukprot:CAMPEP_0197017054 /NCGR_PEP_ID=MMETSP1380-20130617/79324_1 /TAXON_ID=5936 /ORGANISM="Euplotes crassus, Strain CT5" /LENGTH=103 /DNA_ID=CAMNT_0042444103 /DNA_START=1321 /DNA_END=1629 /DNA_ORIENTATION=-